MDSYVALEARTRGDYIVIPSTFTYTGFDFSGVSARCYLRKSPNSTGYISKFSTTGDFSYGSEMSFTPSGLGVASCLIIASGLLTSSWPAGNLYGDIEISREYPAWGPYTPVKFTLPMILDITY
jgi:hypothetical protein